MSRWEWGSFLAQISRYACRTPQKLTSGEALQKQPTQGPNKTPAVPFVAPLMPQFSSDDLKSFEHRHAVTKSSGEQMPDILQKLMMGGGTPKGVSHTKKVSTPTVEDLERALKAQIGLGKNSAAVEPRGMIEPPPSMVNLLAAKQEISTNSLMADLDDEDMEV